VSEGPLLRVEGLSAGYGEMLALRDVSLEVRRAEIVALKKVAAKKIRKT